MSTFTVSEDHQACPKCGSVEVAPFHSHYSRCWIIICPDCRHEEGLEDSERQAWAVWDAAAEAATSTCGRETRQGCSEPKAAPAQPDAGALREAEHAVIRRCVARQPMLMMRGQHEGYYIHSDISDLIDIIGRLAALTGTQQAKGVV